RRIRRKTYDRRAKLELCAAIRLGPQAVAARQRVVERRDGPLADARWTKRYPPAHEAEARNASGRIASRLSRIEECDRQDKDTALEKYATCGSEHGEPPVRH